MWGILFFQKWRRTGNGRCGLTLACAALVSVGMLSGSPTWGSGFALSGVGVKANGMGGAFRAVADDWSAAYWNPAGLAYVTQSEVSVLGQVFSPRPDFTPNITYNGYEIGYGSVNGTRQFPNDRNFLIGGVSGFYRIPTIEAFTFGVAVYEPHTNASEWNLYKLPYPFKGDSSFAYPEHNFQSKVKVVDIHPTIAKEIIPGRLALGMGIGIEWGTLHLRQPFFQSNPFPPPLNSRPEEFFVVDNRLRTSGWGVGANFGALVKIGNVLRMGASLRSPVTLHLDGDLTSTTYFPFNQDILDPRETRVPDSLKFMFDGQSRRFSGTAKGKLNLPWDIGSGVAVFLGKRLTFSADAAYTRWANLWNLRFDVSGKGLLGQPLAPLSVPLHWENTWRGSAGVQVVASDYLTFRGGYHFEGSAIPDETFSPLFVDLDNKHSVNAGAEAALGGFGFGYSFEWLFASRRDISNLADVNGDGRYDNLTGTYDFSTFVSYATVSYRF
jgi:long-chain fatty acid transport protein